MTTLNDLEAKIASQNESIATLQKAYNDLKKDAGNMLTGDSPTSMQIAYSPDLKSKVFEMAPFFRFLESKGRVDDTVIQLMSLAMTLSNTSLSKTRSPCIRTISSSRYSLAQYMLYI